MRLNKPKPTTLTRWSSGFGATWRARAARSTACFFEVRAYLAFDEASARLVIPLLMEESVRQTLLEKEWYKWLPRYEVARQRIRETFDIISERQRGA